MSEVGLNLTYYTWGDEEFTNQFQHLTDSLKTNGVTVGQLVTTLFTIEHELPLQNYNNGSNTVNGSATNKFGSFTTSTPIFDFVQSKLCPKSSTNYQSQQRNGNRGTNAAYTH